MWQQNWQAQATRNPIVSYTTLKKNNFRLPKNRLVYNENSIINCKNKIKTYFNEDIFFKSDKLLRNYHYLCGNYNLNQVMDDINRIKIVIVEKKKTSKWLSEQSRITPSTVSKWCTNTSTRYRTSDLNLMVVGC